VQGPLNELLLLLFTAYSEDVTLLTFQFSRFFFAFSVAHHKGSGKTLEYRISCSGGLCTGKRNGEVLTLLVDRHGKPSLNHPEWSRQSKGASPLHTAARLGQIANAEMLLKLGADVNVVDASGQTALHVAAVHDITGHRQLFYTCTFSYSRPGGVA